MTRAELLHSINELARQAGVAIMKVYRSDNVRSELKSDRSPLTEADERSNQIICRGLEQLDQSIPILSEENKAIAFEERAQWKRFWLVDPLDGTKEFLAKRTEFTVNIALIETDRPTMGVVYAPAMDVLYFADLGSGAWKQVGASPPQQIRVRRPVEGQLTAAVSRSHSSEEEQRVLSEMGVTQTIISGSSLKFCLVAEGSADVYYRGGPTYEWDTAAGQCVLEVAGGCVLHNGAFLKYNKETLLNPSFMAGSITSP